MGPPVLLASLYRHFVGSPSRDPLSYPPRDEEGSSGGRRPPTPSINLKTELHLARRGFLDPSIFGNREGSGTPASGKTASDRSKLARNSGIGEELVRN